MASSRALIFSEQKILLLQRSHRVSRPLQWCLPGGRLLAHESPEDAVIRETLEETGLRIEVLECLSLWQKTHYFHCAMHPLEQKIKLNPRESRAYRWLNTAQLRSTQGVMDKRHILKLVAPFSPQA